MDGTLLSCTAGEKKCQHHPDLVLFWWLVAPSYTAGYEGIGARHESLV